ncbi:MAG: glycosyltransferase family 2 protein [Hyphomicrobiales bacterium]
MPKVAVITRTKERPLMLSRALDSVCSQSMTDFVWAIVNDGGEKGTVETSAETARSRGCAVLTVHNETPGGMEAAANAGISQTASSYIAIHDDDDSWDPRFLETCTSFLDQRPEFVGVVTQTVTVKERILAGKIMELRRTPSRRPLKAIHIADMARSNLFPPISFVYRRDLFEKIGGYDETMKVLGDWNFNLHALLLGDIGLIDEPLARYHVRPHLDNKHDSYSNTVVSGLADHHELEALFRNRHIRNDIAQGKVGLGMMLAIGRLHSKSSDGERGRLFAGRRIPLWPW